MKRLLLQWLSGWLADSRLAGWILASWASALKEKPEVETVDEVPGPNPVIMLVPPPIAESEVSKKEHTHIFLFFGLGTIGIDGRSPSDF